MARSRNESIDLFRTFLMFMIVLQHVAGQGGYNHPWFTNVVGFGVAGFVFISGWFGISFRWKKILDLWGTAVWCACVVAGLQRFCGYGDENYLTSVVKILKGWWYLHAYVALMLLTPLLNAAVDWTKDRGKEKEILLPLLVLAFGWSFALKIPVLCRYLPTTNGLGAATPITFIGIYVLTRLLKSTIERCSISGKYIGGAVFGLSFLSAIGFGAINSPTVYLLIVFLFVLFTRIHIPKSLGCALGRVAPSLFSVYLFHVHSFGFEVILPRAESYLVNSGMPVGLVFLLVSCAIMVGSILLDWPRRLICSCFQVGRGFCILKEPKERI